MSLFKMPSLGADMEAGKLVEWLVKPGDMVKRGDIVAVVETQKGAIEIETFEEGIVGRLMVGLGETVPVGTALAEIGVEADADAPEIEPVEAVPDMPEPAPGSGPGPALALKPELRPEAVRGPAPEPVPEMPIPAIGAVRVSPAARRLAAAEGIDIAALQGSGPGGAVIHADVAAATPKAPPARAGINFDEMRKAIAQAMTRSKRDIPHYYLRHQIHMAAASGWLAETNADRAPEARLLMGTLLVKATSLALTRFPEFNGFYEGDSFRVVPEIHCGIAVAIRGGGLIAPAIHGCERLSLEQLMAAMRDLVGRVRTGHLRSSDLSDPTVTVTSLGERGVDEVFGIIYPPQVAIIGFGMVEPRPIATEAGVADVAPTVIVTLAADHRVSDGRRGALFIREIDKLLQVPEAL